MHLYNKMKTVMYLCRCNVMGPGFQGVKQDIEPTVYFAAKIKRSIENKKTL